jgi:hypothetical protein
VSTTSRFHILLDQGLPRDASEQLRWAGVQCTHVGEIEMSAPSAMPIRREGLKGTAIAGIVREVLVEYVPDLAAGCMIIVKEQRQPATCCGPSTDLPPGRVSVSAVKPNWQFLHNESVQINLASRTAIIRPSMSIPAPVNTLQRQAA